MGFVEWLEQMSESGILVTFIIAMTPVFELRAAIPVGVSLGLPVLEALCVSIIGNMLPVPFILIFIRRIFAWMRSHMTKIEHVVAKLEARAEEKREIVTQWQFWGLVVLVAVPLPGTGAWTGALVAALMDMRLKKAVPAILLGVVIAGLIVTVVTYGIAAIF